MRLIAVLSGLLAFSSGAVAYYCNAGSNIPGADCAVGFTQHCCSDSPGGDRTQQISDCSGGPPCDGGLALC
ncbi:hypothetical protein BUE80_DR009138 [Diplocarpon rosae]|nr:hypothetical protein BUE80_DR009138 [Diplocarpon rosae]